MKKSNLILLLTSACSLIYGLACWIDSLKIEEGSVGFSQDHLFIVLISTMVIFYVLVKNKETKEK